MAVAKREEPTGFVGRFLNRFRNLGSRFGFFKEVLNELKKVHWPTRHQLLVYTSVVLVAVGIFAVLTWVVDSGLSYVMNLLIG